ncbi:MAG: M48 family metallopeptidase [Burkholderiales bacterium]
MSAQIFEKIFIAALLASILLKLWLAVRHIRHIQARRDSIPEDFRKRISIEDHRKAADYTSSKTGAGFASDLVEALAVLGFTLGGGLNMLDSFWSGHVANPILEGMLLIASAVLILETLELPVALYSTFVIEARYGFNKMTLKLFVLDALKKGILGALFGFPLIAFILWLMAEMGERWWLDVWFAWMAFNLFILAVYPTWIAPVFNKFKPLEESSMKKRIEHLLEKCGFKSDGLFVMDGSRRSSHGNAYFTGFGKTKRIVFFDTLLSNLDEAEVEAVLAHELGHFMHRHVIKRIVLSFVLSLVFLWVLGYVRGQAWFFDGLNAEIHSDAMALLLFFMVVPSFTFLLKPLLSFYSRRNEFEADDYAAKQSDAEHLARALTKLYQESAKTLTPDPLYSVFYDSHPPASIRIAHLRKAMHN